jgi:hypothetical protein
MNLTETYTNQCEHLAEIQEEAIERAKWIEENECGFPECHRLDDIQVCRAMGCINQRCPEHMANFYDKNVCQDCLEDLEELIHWLDEINAGRRTPVTPTILKATAILNYWLSIETAKNNVGTDAAVQKEEVNRYTP